MISKTMGAAVKCVLTLVIIAVVCVALLAILNDLLYLPPDVSAFTKAYEAEYTLTDVDEMNLDNGKVTLAANGTASDGAKLIGLYIESNGEGKAKSFTVVVILEKETGIIRGTFIKAQGSSATSYNYKQSKLNELDGTNIKDIIEKDPDMVITGATHSSYAVNNALLTAKQYYIGVFGNK